MKTLLITGLAALMTLGVAAEASAQRIRLAPGESCKKKLKAEEHVLWANIGAGQYAYVNWSDIEYLNGVEDSVNVSEPVFIPMGRNLSYDESQAIASTDYIDGGWYVFRAPATADYVIKRYNKVYSPQESRVTVCFFDHLVDPSELP